MKNLYTWAFMGNGVLRRTAGEKKEKKEKEMKKSTTWLKETRGVTKTKLDLNIYTITMNLVFLYFFFFFLRVLLSICLLSLPFFYACDCVGGSCLVCVRSSGGGGRWRFVTGVRVWGCGLAAVISSGSKM